MFFLLVTGPKDTLPEDVFQVSFPDYEKYLPFIYKSVAALKAEKK
jgi:hypothetical protein